jgi:hypothetical protein
MPKQKTSTTTETALRENARHFASEWIAQHQGSPSDFVQALEERLGWPARHMAMEVLNELRADRELEETHRKYLNYTLSDQAIAAALSENGGVTAQFQSALDELFTRSRRFRRTKEFAEAVEFVSKFNEYSAFNNMLVYLQNPHATFFATAAHWGKNFGRTLKEDARPMLILAPRKIRKFRQDHRTIPSPGARSYIEKLRARFHSGR